MSTSRKLTRTATPGIYRRGSRYVVRVRDAGGRQVQRAARTLAQARRIRAELVDGAARGAVIRVDRQLTIATLGERWKASYTGSTDRGIRPETRREYARDVRRVVDHFGARRRVVEIAPSDVRAFARKLAEDGQATRSVRRIVGVLRLMLASAVEDGLLATNAAAGLRLGGVQVPRVEQDEGERVLDAEQVGALIDATPEGWERLLVRVVAATGLRISEALALQWRDIDTTTGIISVRRRVRDGVVGPVKTGRGRRRVPIARPLARDLAAYRLASRHSAAGAFVFATRNGTARYQTSTYAMLRKAVKQAGVPWPGGWHGLRRSAASAWLRAGVPLADVAELLGHSPTVTMQAYAFAIPSGIPDGEALAAAVGAR